MILQGDCLSMLGLGIRGDDDVVDGNHLRWSFRPEMGFPKYGFKLYRRDRLDCEGKRHKTDFSNVMEGEHPSPFLYDGLEFSADGPVVLGREGALGGIVMEVRKTRGQNHYLLTVKFPETVKDVIISLFSPELATAVVTPYFGARPEARRTVLMRGGLQDIRLIAQSVDSVQVGFWARVTGGGGTVKALLTGVSYIPVRLCDGMWNPVPLLETGLPVSHDDYPYSHGYDDDWKAAHVRLDKNKESRYRESDFLPIREYLEELVVNRPVPQINRVKKEPVTHTSLSAEDREPMQPVASKMLQAVLTAGLDTGVAQMLGLYYVNLPRTNDPHRGVLDRRAYDYKIVGCWSKVGAGGRYVSTAERNKDMWEVDFLSKTLPPATICFDADGFKFASTEVLRIRRYYSKYRLYAEEELCITPPFPLSMVSIKMKRKPGSPLTIRIIKGDGSVRTVPIATSNLCTRTFTDFDSGIVGIEFDGPVRLYHLKYTPADFAWITFNIAMDLRSPVRGPRGLKMCLLPGAPMHGGPAPGMHSVATVGMKWALPPLTMADQNAPVFYEIERLNLGTREPASRTDINLDRFTSASGGRPVLVARIPKKEESEDDIQFPPGWPPQTPLEKEQGIMPVFHIDGGDRNANGHLIQPLQKDSWYAYRVKGIDLFGRFSNPSPTGQWFDIDGRRRHSLAICIRDLVPPPPPLAVAAKFLDPLDNLLNNNERDIMGCNRGIRVTWKWLENLQQQAPDAERFRVYYKAGTPNLLQGSIIADTAVFGPDVSSLTVDFPGSFDIPRNSFEGGRLRQLGKNFVITRHEPGVTRSETVDDTEISITRVRFTVQNLSLPPKETPDPLQTVTLSIPAEHPLYVDYRIASNWADETWNGRLTEVMLETEDTGPLYRISYDIFINESDIPEHALTVASPLQPVVPANIGITAVDDSGNESPVVVLPPIFSVLRDKPPRPPLPDIEELVTGIPDYHGRAKYKICWPVPDDMKPYFHQPNRAMDYALIMTDIKSHGEDAGPREVDIDLIEELHGPGSGREEDIVPHLERIHEATQTWRSAEDDQKQTPMAALMETYTGLPNYVWQYLASLPENADAFLPACKALDTADTANWNGDRMMYPDTLEGKGRNRYFYRIAAMDKAGNLGSMSAATPPVRVPDAFPPKPPVMTKILGGDRKAIIRWRRNTETNMLRYELFRTANKKNTADIRLMAESTENRPVAEIPADSPGIALLPTKILTSFYVDATLKPSARVIDALFFMDETGADGARPPDVNYYGGLKSMVLKVNVDSGEVFVRGTDIHGSPTGDIAAVAANQQVKVTLSKTAVPIASITGVYRREGPLRSQNVYIGISSARIRLNAGMFDNRFSNIKGRPMAVEYTGPLGGNCRASTVPHELEYHDTGLEAGDFYYRLVAVREGVEMIASEPSKTVSAKVFDASPPEPPAWVNAEWVKVDTGGAVHPWTDEVPGYTPAVMLEWDPGPPGFSCLVQQRETGGIWNSASPWLASETVFICNNVEACFGYEFRVKVKNRTGSMVAGEIRGLEAVEPVTG